MLKKNISLVLSLALFVLPGCVKYYDVIKSEFPQAEEYEDHREIAHNYIRSKPLYSEFRTEAFFDVLWLSDEARSAYVDRLSTKRGHNQTTRNTILKRHLEENKHWISFYVLADLRTNTHASMSEKNSYWTVYLKHADGTKIEPLEIKEVDVEPIYRGFFGYRFNQLKTAYNVKFPARDLDGKQYFSSKDPLTLVISSPHRSAPFVWDPKDFKRSEDLLPDEDYYWAP